MVDILHNETRRRTKRSESSLYGARVPAAPLSSEYGDCLMTRLLEVLDAYLRGPSNLLSGERRAAGGGDVVEHD